MSSESPNPATYKVLIGILSLLLIGLAVYTFTLFKDSKETVSTLEQDKIEIQEDLEELIENYNVIIADNELKDKDLLAARERIEVLLDSVKDAEANIGLIQRYRAEINKLKAERIVLFKRADSLSLANQRIALERDSTTSVLNQTIKVVDSMTETTDKMSKTIEKAALLGITNLKSDAVIVRRSGKIVETNRSSRADKLRACYTLAPNTIAQKGDRMLYVQVINPNNNVIGENKTIAFANGELTYSATTNVFYENQALDVCTLVDASEDDLIEGRYVVNVFDQGRLLGNTIIELK